MVKEMIWKAPLGSKTKILHLRVIPNGAWKPYTALPEYAVPDYGMPGESKGWATYQKLFKEGWKLVASED